MLLSLKRKVVLSKYANSFLDISQVVFSQELTRKGRLLRMKDLLDLFGESAYDPLRSRSETSETSPENSLKVFSESLILAQSERWRRGLGMQVARFFLVMSAARCK